MDILTMPAVALQENNYAGFLPACWDSYRVCLQHFKRRRPRAVLAMGGFTSAPPILAGKTLGCSTFLHEANSIPGRANRWLSPMVNRAFVGFPTAGTPVRSQFRPTDPTAARMALGLDPKRPVLLVMGGSQGATAINELVRQMLPLLLARQPDWQFLHMTGNRDIEKMRAAYQELKARAVVLPFLTEMDLALNAARVAVSRAGASALAEIAALQVPSILFPYPAAIDNHQYYNARAFMQTGAARQLDQASATPENLVRVVSELHENEAARNSMKEGLRQWFFPRAAEDIADGILESLGIQAAPAPATFSEDSFDSFLPPRQTFQLPPANSTSR
jgi:UDP-N-acetylglucosamine--N-acetylmuramyl-(pentapeptide) pyrophosphoryl-undecaprenol N-acetylglucosamine transferase